MRIHGAVIVVALAIGACKNGDGGAGGGGGGGDTGEIVVGEVGSMTGEAATFGQDTHRGAEMAVDEVNEAGGIKGRKIRLVTEDDQSRPDEAATAITKLITVSGAAAILGEVASTRSLAMAPIAQRNKIPMISPSSTNEQVTKKGDYIFRVCFIDPFQGLVMAKFARSSRNFDRVAILRESTADYSVGLADVFAREFTKMGGQIVADRAYTNADTNFTGPLTAIKDANPQAIFVPGYYNHISLIARQARELGMTMPLLGGDGWDSAELDRNALNGAFYSNHYSPEDPSPTIQRFIADYRRRHDVVPNGLSALGYDAARVLFDAMKRATSWDSAAVRDAIAATRDFDGVTGRITLDEHRNAVKPAVVLRVEPSGDKYVETIRP
jgi:branched-chain amino acid transport system substrate-binding protein